MRGRQPRPETLEQIANGLGLRLERMRELAGLGVQHTPFVLPSELDELDARRRRMMIAIGWEFLAAQRAESELTPDDDGE